MASCKKKNVRDYAENSCPLTYAGLSGRILHVAPAEPSAGFNSTPAGLSRI